jgi:hypothetical protein
MTAKRRSTLWSPLPTATQLGLLRLVLLARLDAAALMAWGDAADLRALDQGSLRLLPSLYLRLKAAGIDHPWRPFMEGLHRRSLYRNRILVHRGLAVVTTLAREGISCLLLKGAALGARYYADLGERPMGDFDILVPLATPPAKVQALLTAGGSMRLRERALHAHTYLDGDSFEYDIHWHLLPELAYAGSSRRLWERAESVRLNGESWLTLCPEDHVFHLLAHGLRVSGVPPLRWIVDTVAVLQASPDFNWSRLIEHTQQTAMTIPVACGLSFLVSEGFIGNDGAEALRLLEALPRRLVDRYVFAGQMRPPSLGYSVLRPFLLYARLKRLAGEGFVPGFAQFLAALWDLESPRRIPGALLGKLGAKLGTPAAL